jgi:hypothetical protein
MPSAPGFRSRSSTGWPTAFPRTTPRATPLLVGGCHFRDIRTAIQEAGFVIGPVDQLTVADTQMPFPTEPQIIGTATRPW